MRHLPAQYPLSLKGESRCYDFVMAWLDRAIALFVALLLMARSSRTMTLWWLTIRRFSVLVIRPSAIHGQRDAGYER